MKKRDPSRRRAESRDADVAVIGAGAAGLAAAAELTGAGLRVAVIEARDRVGGRVHTVHDPNSPLPVELGAEFIHGTSPQVAGLIDGGNLAAYDAEGDHWYFRNGKLTLVSAFWGEIARVMDRLEKRTGADESFAQFVQRRCRGAGRARARELAMSFVEGFNAAHAERI